MFCGYRHFHSGRPANASEHYFLEGYSVIPSEIGIPTYISLLLGRGWLLNGGSLFSLDFGCAAFVICAMTLVMVKENLNKLVGQVLLFHVCDLLAPAIWWLCHIHIHLA